MYLNCTDNAGNASKVDLTLDQESLLLTVEALKAQLEEQTKLCKEQVSHAHDYYMCVCVHYYQYCIDM